MLTPLLLAVVISPDGFVNGRRCMGSRFATGDILPLTVASANSRHTMIATSIYALQRRGGEVVGFVYEDPKSMWALVESDGRMGDRDSRLSGYKGPVNENWLQQMPVKSKPWTDLTVRLCASARR